MKDNTIHILVDNIEEDMGRERSARPSSIMNKVIDINSDDLAEKMKTELDKVLNSLSKLPLEKGAFVMDQVTFSLSISSSGKVSLFSVVSGEVAAHTGFTFSFTISKDKLNEIKKNELSKT